MTAVNNTFWAEDHSTKSQPGKLPNPIPFSLAQAHPNWPWSKRWSRLFRVWCCMRPRFCWCRVVQLAAISNWWSIHARCRLLITRQMKYRWKGTECCNNATLQHTQKTRGMGVRRG